MSLVTSFVIVGADDDDLEAFNEAIRAVVASRPAEDEIADVTLVFTELPVDGVPGRKVVQVSTYAAVLNYETAMVPIVIELFCRHAWYSDVVLYVSTEDHHNIIVPRRGFGDVSGVPDDWARACSVDLWVPIDPSNRGDR